MQHYIFIYHIIKQRPTLMNGRRGAFPLLSLLAGNKLKSSVIGDTLFGPPWCHQSKTVITLYFAVGTKHDTKQAR